MLSISETFSDATNIIRGLKRAWPLCPDCTMKIRDSFSNEKTDELAAHQNQAAIKAGLNYHDQGKNTITTK